MKYSCQFIPFSISIRKQVIWASINFYTHYFMSRVQYCNFTMLLDVSNLTVGMEKVKTKNR